MKLFLLVVIAGLIKPQTLKGQIFINELSNVNKVMPANEDDEADDWIEIYNGGNEPVNLHYYGLTDKPGNLAKWMFPDVTIQPGQFILVYASGEETEFKTKTEVMHWETAINSHDTWKYFVGKSEPASDWTSPLFKDNSWQTGYGGFGAGQDTCINTVIPSTATSVYSRKNFFIADTSKIEEAVFYMDFTDGFIAYLNGVEIARKNMKDSKSLHNTLATNKHETLLYKGEMPQSWNFKRDFIKQLIKPGNNVLAIQVHKSSPSSDNISSNAYLSIGLSDLSSFFKPNPTWMKQLKTKLHANFKLSAGEDVVLSNTQGIILDECLVPYLQLGHSIGRQTDGTGDWRIFTNPTPKFSNNGQTSYPGYELPPVISIEAGFYAESQSVTITAPTPGAVIRYTTNGNIPHQGSRVYASPIVVNNTMVITARAFSEGKLPSHPVKKSLFIAEETTLPVISITIDSLALWDYNTGMYAKGPGASSEYPFFGANFWNSWEREAHIEVFSKDKQLKASLNTGLRIHGGYSRGFEQKSFRFHFRGNYGASALDYPIIEERAEEILSYKRLVIRNAGQDFYRARFRDGLFQRLSKNTNLDYLAYEPAIVFLNGQYWGHYGIRERTDKHYLAAHHKINPDAIDLLEHKGHILVMEGSDTGFY
ncbi:MAG: CotH kinase family protein, partial [Bacteroidetes bacterium]|nr:CotH kinase family protein [Bacteroidota bacterium]